MIREKILSILILCGVLLFAGCGSRVQEPIVETGTENKTQETKPYEISQMNELTLAIIKTQDENAELKAKIEGLNNQIKTLQDELNTYKNSSVEPENLEQKYDKVLAENNELREMIKYERDLREDLLKKVEKDQTTINDLKKQIEDLKK